jgi:hypothetical protein
MPIWDAQKLAEHHQKRILTDRGCFEELLGISGRGMTETEYERRSQAAVVSSWCEYEAEELDREASRFSGRAEFHRRAAYFVDEDLVVAVTDISREDFRSCFHEHFNVKDVQKAHALVHRKLTVGERKAKYLRALSNDERGGILRNLKKVRDV